MWLEHVILVALLESRGLRMLLFGVLVVLGGLMLFGLQRSTPLPAWHAPEIASAVLALAFILGGGAAFGHHVWRTLAELRARRWRAAGRCAACGYPLAGLPEPRCPECGSTAPPGQR